MQPAQAQPERGLEAGDAVGRALELHFLLVHGVGRMVGGDGIHHAIEDGLDHGVAVGRRAQRRIHLGVGVVEADVLFGQQKVVRRDLAGDAQAVAARLAHRGNGGRCRSMRDVQMRAGVAQLGDEADVALHQCRLSLRRHAAQSQPERDGPGIHAGALGQPRVFGMLDDAESHARRGGQRLAHDAVFENRLAIVGDGHGAGGLESGEVVDGFTLGPARGRGDGEHANDAPRSGACIQRVVSGESFTGVVLGMAATA